MTRDTYKEERDETERQLWVRATIANGGVRPSHREVSERGMRYTYPNGKEEWEWDGEVILIVDKVRIKNNPPMSETRWFTPYR